MPSWKRVIVSGSDAALNSLLVSNGITGSLQGTSSYATTSLSASYALTAATASNGSNIFTIGSNKVFSEYNSGGTANDALKLSTTNLGAVFGVQNTNASGFSGIEYIDNSNAVKVFTGYNNSGNGEFRFNNVASNGFITFKIGSSDKLTIANTGNVGIGTSTPTYKLDVSGSARISGAGNTSISSSLVVYGSGSTQPVFTVQGSQGELFSVTDSLSGSLFSVNDISGLPILEVFSDNTTLMGSYQDPMLITTTKLVTTASGAFTLYSLPTASYDTAFFEYSIRSGSNARAGSIMAIQNSTSVNFTETTTTDFGSTSGFGLTVQVAGANMILTGSATTAGWTIKTIVRGI